MVDSDLFLAVPPEYPGQQVWLQLLGEQLTVTAGNKQIAQLPIAHL
jgi:hypothetical protein